MPDQLRTTTVDRAVDPGVAGPGYDTAYDPAPHYPPVGGSVAHGWAAAVAALPTGVRTLGVDGPAVLDWTTLARGLTAALAAAGADGRVEVVDLRTAARPWPEVLRRTESAELSDDPDFARLAGGELADLLDPDRFPPAPADDVAVQIAIGPGAALTDPDVLWWADLPKRYAEAAIRAGSGRNLAQPAGMAPTTRRLFYIDWPLLDRHRDRLLPRLDRFLDTQDPDRPRSISGATLRRTSAALAGRPFRTRPTFNTTPWGGHWAQRQLGHNPQAPNTALGYELIAPESGVLIGATADTAVELPFQAVVALAPRDVLGPSVYETFGTSFPIRFDYLDTVGGGSLSVHCHPQSDYMRTRFGWPYTQHETYYVMVGNEDNTVYLGLRDDERTAEFEHAAHEADEDGVPFAIEDFVQTFPATPHQLFLIPAGTPHGSGVGNVVLEVSATPYLYSLRFYDWLRRDGADRQRPVHVDHAFANLDPTRSGPAVADRLVQSPVDLAGGPGWTLERIGSLPEMFFEVHRLVLAPGAEAGQDTGGRFRVLTVVEGDGVVLDTEAGHRHRLAYAETIAVPAAVGRYRIRAEGTERVRVVQAQVR